MRKFKKIIAIAACLAAPSLALALSDSGMGINGYWQNFPNGASSVRLNSLLDGYQTIIVAFADIAQDGTVSFTLQGQPYNTMQNAQATFLSDIKDLQASGKKVLLSLGGQNGYYVLNSQTQETNFVTSLSQIIKTYGFDGLDYDFESGLSTSNESYLLDATKQLKTNFANSKALFFTLAPETVDVYWQVFPNGKYDQLIKSGLINNVQVQLYNSGCMNSNSPTSPCYAEGTEDFIVSQADSTIQTWLRNGMNDAPSLYVIGLPASTYASGGGYIDPTVVKSAISCLKTKTNCATYIPTQAYPQLNTLMTWDINWDAQNNYNFVNTLAPQQT